MTKQLRSLRGRGVLITGASAGVGRAIAELAAAEGAHIALVARRAARLEEVADRVRAIGGEAHVIPCDVANRDAALAAVARAETLLGRVDLGVLDAGIGRHRTLLEHDLQEAESLLRVNFLGAMHFAQPLARRMQSCGGGWLVFVASIGGLLPLPGEAVYSASKFAMVGLADSLAVELAPEVHVLTLCPGAIANTEFVRDDERDRITAAHRLAVVTPEQVARAMRDGLARGRSRVVVPAWLGLVVALRGLWPSVVRRGTAIALAPMLRAARRATAAPRAARRA